MKLGSTILSSALVLTLGAPGQDVYATSWEDDSGEAPGAVEILSTSPVKVGYFSAARSFAVET